MASLSEVDPKTLISFTEFINSKEPLRPSLWQVAGVLLVASEYIIRDEGRLEDMPSFGLIDKNYGKILENFEKNGGRNIKQGLPEKEAEEYVNFWKLTGEVCTYFMAIDRETYSKIDKRMAMYRKKAQVDKEPKLRSFMEKCVKCIQDDDYRGLLVGLFEHFNGANKVTQGLGRAYVEAKGLINEIVYEETNYLNGVKSNDGSETKSFGTGSEANQV